MIHLLPRDARLPGTAPEPTAAPGPNSRPACGSLHFCQAALPGMDLDPDNPLAAEIRQEMAAAYFVACKKMVASLEALKAFNLTLAVSQPLNNAQITRRSELLGEAAERVHFVLIQRDAMNLSGHEKFFEDYEVPHEVRKQLGKSRRE